MRYETRAERRRRRFYLFIAALYTAAAIALLVWGIWGYNLPDPSQR